ncbi:MAG: glycosyltransferase family 39 protein [Pseudomonadales bacterium]
MNVQAGRRGRPGLWPGLVAIAPLGLGLLGALLLAASLVNFSEMKAAVDALSPDGDAERFGRERFESSIRMLRVYSGLLWSLGLGAFLFRRDLYQFDPGASSRRLLGTVRADWSATPLVVKAFLGASLAIGLALRLLGIQQPIRSDEAWTYLSYVSRPLMVGLSEYSSPNNHILHTVLSHISLSAFGDSEAALRVPALIAGVCSIPLAYLLFRQWANPNVGMLSCAAVAAWPMLVDYSVNARGYSLIVLFTLGLTLAADRMRQCRSVAPFAAFAVISALGLYAVPSFSLSILTCGIWLLLLLMSGRMNGTAPRFLRQLSLTAVAALVLTSLLYAPVLTQSSIALLIGNDVVSGEGVTFPGTLAQLEFIRQDWLQGVPAAVGLIAAAGFIVFLVRAPARFSAFWLALAIAGTIVAVLQGTLGPPRVWIFALPLFIGCAAWGILSVVPARPQPAAALSLGAMLLLAGLVLHVASPTRTLYREFGAFEEAGAVVRVLAARMQPEDGLLTDFPANRTVNYEAKKIGLMRAVNDARRAAREDTPARIFVVVPADQDVAQVLAFNDRVFGTDLQQRSYRSAEQIAVGRAHVEIVGFDPGPPYAARPPRSTPSSQRP